MGKLKEKFIKVKNPIEIYDIDKLLTSKKDYPVGSIVYTKFKKSPRYNTKKGHYVFSGKKEIIEENLFGTAVKKTRYFWVRVK